MGLEFPYSTLDQTGFTNIDPRRIIAKSYFELLLNDEFSPMKNRCIPSDLDEAHMRGYHMQDLQEKDIYYSIIPFSEEKLSSPSFNDAQTFPNLIMDDEGALFQLLFSYTEPPEKGKLPPGHRLISVTEWRNSNGLVARRLNRYV